MTDLEQLNAEIKTCSKCPLREYADAPVCGYGNIGSKYFLIGEGPGSNESKSGIPFVGMAGKRLNQLLELAKIDINTCYLTNVVKCQPESNRNPRKNEIKACVPFLWREIKIVRPEILITLGSVPLSLFSKYGVKSTHGTLMEVNVPDGNS